jgi:hypothetical protein
MITYKLPIQLTDDEKKMILEFQRIQSSMIRSAYKQAEYGCAEISIRQEIRDRFKDQLDSWFQQSAVKCGIGMFKSDHETGRSGRIFGGKGNLIRRAKGLISNEEWKQKRLLPLYLVGEAPTKGNRKFEFREDHVVFKPYNGCKIKINLPSMRKNWSKIWKQLLIMTSEKQIPITVSLTIDSISFSFDDTKVKQEIKKIPKPIKNRYAGIDMNPNYIGISVFNGTELIETKLFSLKSLTGKNASASKLEHETREIGHAIGKWLQHLRVDKLFIEKLKFKQGDKRIGKNFNRLTQNQWKKITLRSILAKYFKLYEINAAYSSTIGNTLHPELPDPIAASTEIAQRGYRLVILKNKQFYPKLPAIKYLEDLWKETKIPLVNNWKELHSWVKNSKLKYRVPVPDESVFRIFQSPASLVGVL